VIARPKFRLKSDNFSQLKRKKTRGVSHCGLAIYIKKYLKGKKKKKKKKKKIKKKKKKKKTLWKLKIIHHTKI